MGGFWTDLIFVAKVKWETSWKELLKQQGNVNLSALLLSAMKLLYLMSKFVVLCSFETIYWKISLWKPSLFPGWIIALRGGGRSTLKMFSLKTPLLVEGNDLYLREMKYSSMKHNHRECIGIWKWQLYWKRSSSWVTFYYRNLTVQEAWSYLKFIIVYFYSLLAPETNLKRNKSFQVCPASQVLLEHYIIFL